MFDDNLCEECSEPLHENCGLCHNPVCDLFVEEEYCGECNEEICHACGDICHNCEKNATKSLSQLEAPKFLEEFKEFSKKAGASLLGTVQPIVVMYAVPDKPDHKEALTCGIIVLKMFSTTSKTIKLPPIYKVITFTFLYTKGIAPNPGGTMFVYPTSFRISSVFGNKFSKMDVFLYLESELKNFVFPPIVNGEESKWSLRLLVSPLHSHDLLCNHIFNGTSALTNMEVSYGLLENFDYDYPLDCENQE